MPRSKPHFKVFTTLKNHRKFPGYADNDALALWVRLGIEAVERFADRTGDSFVLNDRELRGLAGEDRLYRAVARLDHLVSLSPIEYHSYCPICDPSAHRVPTMHPPCAHHVPTMCPPCAHKAPKIWVIYFPNFAEKQFFRKSNSTESGSSATATATATPLKRKKPTREPSAPPPDVPSRLKKEPAFEARALAVWPALRDAAAEYGVTWAKTPGTAQKRIVATRLRSDDLTEDGLIKVVHGYIALRGTTISGDFNPLVHLVPKTLYAPSNWPDYLAAGVNPPPVNDPEEERRQRASVPRTTNSERARAQERRDYVPPSSEEIAAASENADAVREQIDASLAGARRKS